MKNLSILAAAIICLVDLSSCGTTTTLRPPPVTPELARTASRQHVRHGTNPSDWRIELATLREGRALFVSRCIECHTLPAVAQHSTAQWPGLIDEMADRANLKPAERETVLAYILAARTQL